VKYYIIAGEASGDMHGANLIRALAREDVAADIRYWGGDSMAAAIAENPSLHAVQVRHIRELAYMGIVEVVSHLGTILGNMRCCKKDILTYRPDIVILIDYPGFNLDIAKFAHQQGIKNLYYISPQVWAWKQGRLRKMRRYLDRLCYILPSERPYYADGKLPQAVYVGHPLLDEVERYRSTAVAGAEEKKSRPTVALLPGSRKQELRRMLPVMAELASRHPECDFVIAGMSLIGEAFYRELTGKSSENIRIVYDQTYRLLGESDAAVVCSGTATLETTLFRVPQVVCYQCNKLSAAMARVLIGDKIKYISLVNLIADSRVVTELIQSDFNVERLDEEFRLIVREGEVRSAMLAKYDEVIETLGGKGASERTAAEVMKLITDRK